ncbi:hypothetical protein [Lederbergia galactosidilytica]|uniref:Uncharacterized protein n=1 Tax=Lederbergia galactosidilytica TaxID=217031 RepID=A0A177ZLP4_9BACI|nr:hypothetical protein [Lederbergia galactosidilytica]KRG08904.1 hypothetical protein ACA30_22350 [Virgibacillus soli]MBP1916148.1 hypothetical protein [Lederbergia galactosidilytica]OAK68399.1 hypothetical protein ABB05_15015 [Lederbergia galactosidilytica]
MTTDQSKAFEKVLSSEEKLNKVSIDYWHQFSFVDTWQFWFDIVMLIAPLIVLFFVIDRKNIFLLGFYGFNIHVWFGYIDVVSMRLGLVNYPYFIIPYFQSLSLDAALLPVLFMLVYQWTLKRGKNFYLYSMIMAAFLAFVFKPIMTSIHFIQLGEKMSYFKMFLVYIGLFLFSKAITSLFLHMQSKVKKVETK